MKTFRSRVIPQRQIFWTLALVAVVSGIGMAPAKSPKRIAPRSAKAMARVSRTVSSSAGPLSAYFLTAGPTGTNWVLQGALVTNSWSQHHTALGGEYPIAVAKTVRTLGNGDRDPIKRGPGSEYTLAGAYTGTDYPYPGADESFYDGASDGTFNYSLGYYTGKVYKFNSDWTNPVVLFTTAPGYLGITFDRSTDTLWVSDFDGNMDGTAKVENRTLSGTLISSFTVPFTSITCLALDPADGTLWMGSQNTKGTFYQYSRAGELLNTVSYSDLTTQNTLGGEFAIMCVTAPANMVSWWKGDGNLLDVQNGNTLSSGNGNGVGYAVGKVSQAFNFDGTQFLSAGNPANLAITGTAVTIDGWIKPTATFANFTYLFGRAGSGAHDYTLALNSDLTGIIKTGISDPGLEHFVHTGYNPPLNQWTHVALTYDGSTITVYANGVAVGTESKTGNITDDGSSAPFNIGGRSDCCFYTGGIDEVEVFDRALSASEIKGLYEAGSTGKCAPPLQLISAASRKHHQDPGLMMDAGTFDVDLPLAGNPGVECRSGGANQDHKIVFTFNHHVVSGGASLTGVGSFAGGATFEGTTMVLNLTGVADEQQISVTINGVTDGFGQVLPQTTVDMIVLLGDTNANKSVNASDIAQTKSQSGNPVTAANFREDTTVNGQINGSDISQVKSRSGHGLP
jgi:hypothetical protein